VVRLPREGDGPVVLHVEDNAFNLKLVERVLEQRPEIRLAETRTGAAGLALARDLVPSLILLDLRLPDIPGDSVLRLLREDVMTREIPVVMISAEARPVEADRLLAAGANEFLVKPIDIRTLLDVVDRILARARP
jgi:CheY-like chemotaxis protein